MNAALLKAEVDLTGLNRFNSQLFGVLLGTGQGGMGDLHRFLSTEAGQLADTIQKQIGPKTQAQGNASIVSNVKTFLNSSYSDRAGVEKYTTFISAGPMNSSYSGFNWLTAGPNFLLGIKSEDLQTDISGPEAIRLLKTAQAASHSRGKAYVELGSRNAKNGKHQRILQLNRIRVSTAAFNAAVKELQARVGSARAAFAYAATKLVGKSYPSWITRHFNAATDKSIFDDSQLKGENPSITFGSRAKGVVSNPYLADKIHGAVKYRQELIASKINKVIKGYTYNWNTGQVFREQVPKGGLPD